MKMLRIGTSDDVYGPLEPPQRSWHIVQERLAEWLGEPVETILKSAWPNDAYAHVIERWIEREKPDAVFLGVASYWVSFPSAPLALEEARVPLAPMLGRLATAASRRPRIAHNGAFRLLRRVALRTTGYRYLFEPDGAARRVEDAIRRITRHEDIALGVRGPLPLGIPLPPRLAAESRARCREFDRLVQATCKRLHVPYLQAGEDEPPRPHELQRDLTHVNERGHARRAEHEFQLMHQAWLASRGGTPAPR